MSNEQLSFWTFSYKNEEVKGFITRIGRVFHVFVLSKNEVPILTRVNDDFYAHDENLDCYQSFNMFGSPIFEFLFNEKKNSIVEFKFLGVQMVIKERN